ncbi:MAG: UDP-glucose/GDP-mannose dehydrogenase family protein [Gemmatimonadota bacterium]
MNLGVFGVGYVGLVTGTCFAEMGNRVVCCDIDAGKIETLKHGKIPFYEPGLEELVTRNVAEGRLSFTTDTIATVETNEVLFIAVGTPSHEDGSPDISGVLAVAKMIGEHANAPKLLVNKSTVPVGTADRMRAELAKTSPHPCSVISNPEFLKEGTAVDDFLKPDRVIVGADDEADEEVMRALYAPFVRTGKPILFMDTRSSEMTKYAANAMLASRITFMNEIANLCEAVGANVDHVRAGVGADRRLGASFLFAGVGFGGSCFPKDVQALQHLAEEVDYEFTMIDAVHRVNQVNQRQRRRLVDKVRSHYGEDLGGRRFALWGLAFKPQTDDVREAPSLTIIEELLTSGAEVVAFDPIAMESARCVLGDQIEYASDSYEALDEADALIIITEWNEFRFPDFERIKQALREPIVFDGRNVFNLDTMAAHGFVYYSIGRRTIGRKG